MAKEEVPLMKMRLPFRQNPRVDLYAPRVITHLSIGETMKDVTDDPRLPTQFTEGSDTYMAPPAPQRPTVEALQEVAQQSVSKSQLDQAVHDRLTVESLAHEAWMRMVILCRGGPTPSNGDTLILRRILTALEEMTRT